MNKKTSYEILKDAYSVARLKSYKDLCENKTEEECVKLYWKNQNISTFMFMLLSHLELLLRNKVHLILLKHIKLIEQNNNNEWVIHSEFNSLIANSSNNYNHKTRKYISDYIVNKLENALLEINHKLTQEYKKLRITNLYRNINNIVKMVIIIDKQILNYRKEVAKTIKKKSYLTSNTFSILENVSNIYDKNKNIMLNMKRIVQEIKSSKLSLNDRILNNYEIQTNKIKEDIHELIIESNEATKDKPYIGIDTLDMNAIIVDEEFNTLLNETIEYSNENLKDIKNYENKLTKDTEQFTNLIKELKNSPSMSTNYIINLLISDLNFGVYTSFLNNLLGHNNKEIQEDTFNVLNLAKFINSTNLKDKQSLAINNFIKTIRNLQKIRNKCAHHKNIIKNLNILQSNFFKILEIFKKVGGIDYFYELESNICSTFSNYNSFEDIFYKILTGSTKKIKLKKERL